MSESLEVRLKQTREAHFGQYWLELKEDAGGECCLSVYTVNEREGAYELRLKGPEIAAFRQALDAVLGPTIVLHPSANSNGQTLRNMTPDFIKEMR